MTTIVTRPDTTISQTGTVLVGAGSREAALSDSDDSSYVTLDDNSDDLFMGFPPPTIPAGFPVIRTALRARTRKGGSNNARAAFSYSPDVNIDVSKRVVRVISWSHETTTTLAEIEGEQETGDPAMSIELFGDDNLRMVELYFDTVVVDQPVVSVDKPTGTLTEDNQPTVRWTTTYDNDGGQPTNFEVKIFNAAQYGAGGFDPDTSTPFMTSTKRKGNVDSWTLPDTLPNDSYRAYVRVAQTVNDDLYWSEWDHSNFTENVLSPGTPDIDVIEQASFGRNEIDITDNDGDVVTTWLALQRSLDNDNWSAVRTLNSGRVDPDDPVAWDYDAPNSLTVYYRARALHIFSSGLITYSDWSSVEVGAWSSPSWWIKHPSHPERNRPVTLRSQPGHSRPARQGLMNVLGKTNPVSVEDVRLGPSGDLVVRAVSDAERQALVLLVSDGSALLIQAPVDVQDWPDRWCSIGEYARERALDASWFVKTFDSLPWTEVDRPSGDVVEWLDPVTDEFFDDDNLVVV